MRTFLATAAFGLAGIAAASLPAQAAQIAFFVTQSQIEAADPGIGAFGCASGLAAGSTANGTGTCAVYAAGLTAFNSGNNTGGIYSGATDNSGSQKAFTATSANLSSGSSWTEFGLIGTVGQAGALEAVDTTGSIAYISAAPVSDFSGNFTTANGSSTPLPVSILTAGTSLEFIVNSSALTVGNFL